MTTEADSIVTANYVSAFRASPPVQFLFQETLDAILFNKYQVLNHTHVIKSAVSLIECFQALAWKIITVKTEADKPSA